MLKRISNVNDVKVNIVAFSSTFQIGDVNKIHGLSNVLAIQKDQAVFINQADEVIDHHSFIEELPFPMMNEQIQTTFINKNPLLRVGKVYLNGLIFSSIFQIGNSEHTHLETKIKHIRQLKSTP